LANRFNLGANYADQTVEPNSTPRPAVTIPLNAFCNIIPVDSELCDEN
jgi:hypothetical protein